MQKNAKEKRGARAKKARIVPPASKKPPHQTGAASRHRGLRPGRKKHKRPPGKRPEAGAFHSLSDSKFKAPKTPLPHGLTGFAATKTVAKTSPAPAGAGGCNNPLAATRPTHA